MDRLRDREVISAIGFARLRRFFPTRRLSLMAVDHDGVLKTITVVHWSFVRWKERIKALFGLVEIETANRLAIDTKFRVLPQ